MKLHVLFLPLLGFVIGSGFAWLWIPRFDESRWLEVRSITIGDARVGESPRVQIDRTIHLDVVASWTVTLKREEEGSFVMFCTQNGQTDFNPDSPVPPEIDLNWMLNVPPNRACQIAPPGRYLVTAVWILEIEGRDPRAVRAESNVFEVSS